MPRVYIRKEHRISQDTGIEEKHCSYCNTWKSLEAYHKDKKAWDNLRTICKTCANVRSKKQHRELYATEEGRERRRANVRKAHKKREMNGKRMSGKRAYERERKKDPTYRLKHNIRNSIYNGIKGKA